MIAYIRGRIIWFCSDKVIVEISGIGYAINFKNTFASEDVKKQINLFITVKRSEFSEELYGFASIEEKLLFDKLINIKGVGAKQIFQIMHQLSIKNISDLSNITLDKLMQVSGVGKKTAQKFMFGLSIITKDEGGFEQMMQSAPIDIKNKFRLIISALKEFGFSQYELEDFILKNYEYLCSLDTKEVIEYVLKNISTTK
ncbi:MAG: Holliday junction ATP-dependent DNA helicase RuvA [Candidatus Dojkabacteria bacterium]|nr:MAG: Holliday junction ATP-dependent DNA helicase RuvA [Candidatus Dojkabacteria bacterium]